MARAGRYWWQRLSLAEKRRRTMPPPAMLFRCRICRVQVTARDRQGHADRAHGGGDVLVVFEVVRS